MKNLKKGLKLVSVLALLLGVSACASFTPGWKEPATELKPGDAASLFQQAKDMEKTAATREQVLDLIEAYKRVVEVTPGNYNALWRIGNYHMLMGAAYSADKSAKRSHYKEAVKYCEKAMYLNPSFKKEVDKGAPVWDAAAKLDVNYVDALGCWCQARFYYFMECLTPLGRRLNSGMIEKNNVVISRIDALAPDWAGGGNYFLRALYFLEGPERSGGSRAQAAAEFDKAIKAGPASILNRWGRAKYLYSLTGNKEGYLEDLKWVQQQEPLALGTPYPWTVYLQAQAASMIAAADKAFK